MRGFLIFLAFTVCAMTLWWPGCFILLEHYGRARPAVFQHFRRFIALSLVSALAFSLFTAWLWYALSAPALASR